MITQWDADHDPAGEPQERRAIQLGLRGGALEDFAKRELMEVIDMTGIVVQGRGCVGSGNVDELMIPFESVYAPGDPVIAARIGLSGTG